MNRGLIIQSPARDRPTTLFFGLALALFEGLSSPTSSRRSRRNSRQMMSMKSCRPFSKGCGGDSPPTSRPRGVRVPSPGSTPVVRPSSGPTRFITCTRVPAGEVDRAPSISCSACRSRAGAWSSPRQRSGSPDRGSGSLWPSSVTSSAAPTLTPPPRAARARADHDRQPRVFFRSRVGAIAWLVSALSDRRGRAITTVFIIVVASFLVNYLAQCGSPPSASRSSACSTTTAAPDPARRNVAGPRHGGAGVVRRGRAVAAAGIVFARRDLNTV